jgi:outer membrane protein assembly factor BamB
MIRHIALFLLVALGSRCPASAGEAGDGHEWPMKSGNAGWTGFSTDERVKPPFRLKWATMPGESQPACVTVADGRLYGRDVCLDAETGEILWKSGISSNTPTYEGGRLFGGGGRVSAIDAATGKRVWSQSGYLCNRTYKTAVTACDGTVYAGRIKEQGGKKFYFAEALDAASGEVRWSTPLVPAEGSPPKGNILGVAMSNAGVGGGRVFISTHEPKIVFGLDQKTGRELWRREGVVARHALSTDGKTVWAAECAQGVTALDAASGEKLWHWGGSEESSAKAHYMWTGTADHPPTAAYGKLFVGCYGRNYTVLDSRTGAQVAVLGDRERGSNMWGGGCGPLTAAGGFVYSDCMVGQDFNKQHVRRDLYAIDPKTGKPVWRWALSGKSCCRVAIAYGRLYAVTRHEIYCFEPLKEGEKLPEPQAAPGSPAGALTAMARPPDPAQGKPAGGADWPMYGGCPARCGLDVKISLPIKPAWKFDTGGKVRSSPAVAGGVVYAGSDSGELFALDLATGTKKWSAKAGPSTGSGPRATSRGSRVRCAPAVAPSGGSGQAGGIVVVGADDGVLRAFDAASGAPKWEFKSAGRITASPAIVGDRVVFGSWDGHCYCLRLADGKEFWRHKVGDPGVRVHAPPAVAHGRVYLGALEDFEVYVLDLGTGKPLGDFKKNGPVRGTKTPWLGSIQGLAVYRGKLASTKRGGAGTLQDAASGEIVGRFGSRCEALFSLPAFDGELVYHPSSSEGIKLSEVAPRGSAKKRPPLFRKSALNAPLVGGGLMIVATEAGTLEAYRPGGDASKPVWEWTSASGAEIHTAPAAAGGFVVIGSDDGHVYGFSCAR